MSAFRRIVIGASGNWAGIGIVFAQRLLLTPILLSVWSAAEYGTYLALTALFAFVTLPGRSYETVVSRELLRIGARDASAQKRLFCGSLPVALLYEAAIAIVFYVALRFGSSLSSEASTFLAGSEVLVAGVVFFTRALSSFPGSAMSGLLSAYGYYPKLVWLGLVGRLLAMAAATSAAMWGYGPAGVACAELLGPCLFTIPAWIILRKWACSHDLWNWCPDVNTGVRILFKSTTMLLAEAAMMLRGEGIRLVLAPLSGSVAVARFTTVRTAANVMSQGLSTMVSPVVPEMMRYLQERDQQRVEASLAFLWAPVVFVLVPAALLLQLFIGPIFEIWTRDKVAFNPLLFALLSSAVVWQGVALGATAIVTGNNLLSVQLRNSLVVSCVILLLLLSLVPVIGIYGAGAALLAGDITGLFIYVSAAARWMKTNKMAWPSRLTRVLVIMSTATTAILCGISHLENKLYLETFGTKALAAVVGLLVLGALATPLIQEAKSVARNRMPRWLWGRSKERV